MARSGISLGRQWRCSFEDFT